MSTAELEPMHQSRRIAASFDQPRAAARRLHTDIDYRGSAAIVDARGEVDAYTLPAWRRVLREATAHATAPGAVIVDICRLDFISCEALVSLALDAHVCRERRINVVVVSRASIVHRFAAATGLYGRIPIHPSTESALRSVELGNRPAAAGGRGGIR